jgi:hypothetical protein
MPKITFGMIIFESDFVLQECLEQVYPFAHSIVIAEGPVSYWQRQGRTTSTDRTNEILDSFPDPHNKIKIVHGQYNEKDDQCRAYIDLIPDDTEYLWNLDADEIYKTNDLINIFDFLDREQPSSLGVQSCTFYGGFNRYLTGFEQNTDNFLRIFKYAPGSTWLTHRPPTLLYKYPIEKKHINSKQLFDILNFQMYHYSYVFPDQVYRKISYYKDSVSKDNCIDNYFTNVYMPWITGNQQEKESIENKFLGVHEFKPMVRGYCYTSEFIGDHPESINKNLISLQNTINNQLKKYEHFIK